jgi:LPXTG-motif cell wall-anchored protein
MPDIEIPKVLIPKTGTSTSSFWVLIAAWIVGGLFTGLFSVFVKKGYLDEQGGNAMKGWLINVISEALPIVWVSASAWMTRAYIQARGKVAEQKAISLGDVIKSQTTTGEGATTANVTFNQESK